MRTDVKIDKREIRCPNASAVGSSRKVAVPDDCILYDDGHGLRLARVLGRVSAPATGSGETRTEEVKGWALAMVMADNHRHTYERWVNPKDIKDVFSPSPKLAALFNSPVVSVDVREALAKGELSEGNLEHDNDGTIRVRVAESGKRGVPLGDDGHSSAAVDLLAAAELVLARWEKGDLAEAVRELDAAVQVFRAAPHQHSRPFRQELSDGTKIVEWKTSAGRLHREDGPAVEAEDGRKEWYHDGKRHRSGGPAVEWASGEQYWYHEGELHREGGPAMVRADGTREWHVNGQLHREDGPAIERPDGTREWYLFGREIAPEKFEEAVRHREEISRRASFQWRRDLEPLTESEIALCHEVLKREVHRASEMGLSKGRRDDYRTDDPREALLCRSEAEVAALSKNIGLPVEKAHAFEDDEGKTVWALRHEYERHPYLTAFGVFLDASLFANRDQAAATVEAEQSADLEEDEEETQGISR